jgi:hypothetical protein
MFPTLKLQIESAWDLHCLNSSLEFLRRWPAQSSQYFARLRPDYEDYVTRVSTPDMAISLELAGLLLFLAETVRPARILDLGSGFSSFVLRQVRGASVLSVDDDANWLNRTSEYLREKNCENLNLALWSDLVQLSPEPFDLIFHDLALVEQRRATLSQVLEWSKGWIVLDDGHKAGYITDIRTCPRNFYSLRRLAMDMPLARFPFLGPPKWVRIAPPMGKFYPKYYVRGMMPRHH